MVCYREKFYFFYSDLFLTVRILSLEQGQTWGSGVSGAVTPGSKVKEAAYWAAK